MMLTNDIVEAHTTNLELQSLNFQLSVIKALGKSCPNLLREDGGLNSGVSGSIIICIDFKTRADRSVT